MLRNEFRRPRNRKLRKTHVGYGLPIVTTTPADARPWHLGAGPAEVARLATHAEALGFDHVTMSDHVVVPKSRAHIMGEG